MQNLKDKQAGLHALNRRLLWRVFVFVVLVLVCLIGAEMFQEHAYIDAEERKQLTTQATVGDDNLTRSLMSVDAAIDTISHDLPWLLAQPKGSLLINSRLHALVNVLIGTRTLIIVNADGDVITANQSALIEQNFLEEERFRTIRQESDPKTLFKFGSLGVLTLLGIVAILFHGRRQREFLGVFAAREAERLQSEQFASSERFIRTITDAMPGLVAYFDCELRCQFANKAYRAWYGQSVESILGNTLLSLMGATRFALNEAQFRATLAGESQQFERFLTRPDGSIGHGLVHYIPDIDENGRVLGFIIAVVDIQAIKLAESELRLADKVFACISEAIMVTDCKGVILSVNPAFTEITGYSAQEALGQTPSLLHSAHHSPEFHAALWNQVRDTGLWQGETWNRKKSGELFLERQTITKIAGTYADKDRYVAVFQDITATWKKNESIRHLAFHDALTNLPNRRLLMERVEQHIVSAGDAASGLAVLFLDLDHFKVVNDELGHAAGDALLMTVARKLHGLLRESDTVARLGGDEFVILLDSPVNRIEIERIANRIIAVINEPMTFQGKMARVGASVGIAVYPEDGTNAGTLLKHADLSMYQAKDAGRNTYRFFMSVEGPHQALHPDVTGQAAA